MNDAKVKITRIRKGYNRKIFRIIRQIANGKKIAKSDIESTQKFTVALENAVSLTTEILGLREHITSAIKEGLLAQEGIEEYPQTLSKKTKKKKKQKDSTPPGIM